MNMRSLSPVRAAVALLACSAAACGASSPSESATDSDGGQAEIAAPLPSGDDYGGWTYVEVDGSLCRDGSPAGYYYRRGSSRELLIYLNGGGACADRFFCGLNPVNVNQDMPLEWLIEGTFNLAFGPTNQRQLPPDEGIFKRDPRNPVGTWNMIYVPYCTGDIHAGVNRDISVPNVEGKQQFVGYTNFGLFLDSFGPAFAGASQVLLTGSSAGGFGTLLNFDRTQEFFDEHGGAQVLGLTDSGIPMQDPFMAACLQKRWREYWGIDKIPAMVECGEPCQHADGGGLTEGLADYMFHDKYKGRMLGGAVSTVHDQIIRAFFAPGLSSSGGPDDCSIDPGINTVLAAIDPGFGVSAYTGEKFQMGLKSALDFLGGDQLGYYAMQGEAHMHIWRSDYYSDNGLGTVMADWVKDILAGKNAKVGDL